MTLDDLAAELKNAASEVYKDPCALVVHDNKRRQPPYNRPASRVDGYAGCHVVIVENEETGLAEYRVMYPDGHLGAVEA